VDRDGKLAPEAIERTAAVLREYARVFDERGIPADAQRVRVTATSAARDASNRDDFFAAVKSAVGVEPDLLTGEEEGRLSFRGATGGLEPAQGPFLVIDIGGGSTEFVTGTLDHHLRPHVTGVRSVDLGCVRLTERFLHTDPPSAVELAAAANEVGGVVTDALDALPHAKTSHTIVGLAGTVAAAAAIDAGIHAYDRAAVHHRWLSAERIASLTEQLASLPVAQRHDVIGLERERADVIVGGLLVLRAILDATGAQEFVTSEADILDGLALSLLDQPT